MNAPPEARRLFAMALKDWRALQSMADPVAFADEIVGFHAQQTIEKALKAWSAALGAEYPHTHDLGRLVLTLESLGADVAPFRSLVAYSAFSVQFRYEAFEEGEEEPLDRLLVIQDLQPLIQAVEGLLSGP